MKVIDFHPDQLLDREIEGTLSIDDQRRLRDHLERCNQCRLERQLRTDFEEELGTLDDAKEIQLFVSGALRAARPPSSRSSRIASSFTWRRRFMVLLAATLVLATGIAAANVEVASRAWKAASEKVVFMFRAPSPDRSVSKASPPSAKGRANDSVAANSLAAANPVNAPSLPATTGSAPQVETTSLPGPDSHIDSLVPTKTAPVERRGMPITGAGRRPEKGSSDAAMRVAEAPARTEETPIPAPSAQVPSRPRDTAAALFDDASAARRRGNIVEATALYRDLQARFPASPEARVSIAVVARMQLDVGETAAAASGFAAYLATGDRALREEAMAGRAVALGRLGRTRDETGAWRDLVRAYPRSGYANIARTRMERDLP